MLTSCYKININFAFADITYYAKILTADCYLYSSTDESSAIFCLPETYFVELLSKKDDYYYARYNDIYGYVKTSLVKAVQNTPNAPFLTNVSFRVFVPSGANLRSSPQNLGAVNLVYSLNFLETNILYYGTITGEEAISKKGNLWYYCKYYMNNTSYFGYIYAPLTDCLGEIVPNQEQVVFIEGELQFKEQSNINNISQNAMEGLSSTAQTVIIIAISLPCLLFIYLLFKPTQMAESANKHKSKKNSKKKISRLKHSDYYEYDDNFN